MEKLQVTKLEIEEKRGRQRIHEKRTEEKQKYQFGGVHGKNSRRSYTVKEKKEGSEELFEETEDTVFEYLQN